MTSWERAGNLVDVCLSLMPLGKKMQLGKFLFDGENEFFSYYVIPVKADDKPIFVSAVFEPEQELVKKKFMGLGLADGDRNYFLLKDSIWDEPALSYKKFPDYSFRWDRDPESGQGLLRFFRIDFSLNDFINYEGPELIVSFQEGDEKYFSRLPEKLEQESAVFGKSLPHTIDFEEMAGVLLERSKLVFFRKFCRRRIHSKKALIRPFNFERYPGLMAVDTYPGWLRIHGDVS